MGREAGLNLPPWQVTIADDQPPAIGVTLVAMACDVLRDLVLDRCCQHLASPLPKDLVQNVPRTQLHRWPVVSNLFHVAYPFLVGGVRTLPDTKDTPLYSGRQSTTSGYTPNRISLGSS
jgi:hypothetical protein